VSLIDGIQAALNAEHPGWNVNHFVCMIGAERVNSDGDVEGCTALFVADGQADYITTGLLCAVDELRYCEDED
jgi:hypothetical protein